MYGTNVVDGIDLGTATRHPKNFAEANDIIANLPMERKTRVEISRTHMIFDYSTISFLDTVVQLAKMEDG